MDPCSIGSMSLAVDSMPKVKSPIFLESAVDVKQEEDFKDTFIIDGDSHKGSHMKEENPRFRD